VISPSETPDFITQHGTLFNIADVFALVIAADTGQKRKARRRADSTGRMQRPHSEPGFIEF